MHKLDLFKLVLKSETYRKRGWVISAFSVIQEDTDAWKKNPYPYRIVQTPTTNYFYNPQIGDLEVIEGCTPGNPIYKFTDRIVLEPNELPNVKQETQTTLGNAYYNRACVCDAFGDKVAYQSGKNLSNLESEIATRLRDTPLPGNPRDAKYLYCDEYVKFCDAVFYLTNFSQLCTWGLTEKVVTPPPGVKELKKKLMAKYKDQLHDPAILAMIMTELKKLDTDYLKGDPGENFLLSKKSRDVVRSRLFLAYGAEAKLDGSKSMDFVPNSLQEGWDVKSLPVLNNASRGGSYSRGAETMLGGVSFKELNRAFANMVIESNDCGSKMGKSVKLDKANLNQLVGFSIIHEDGTAELIEEPQKAEPYLGKVIKRRSPLYCVAGTDKLCAVCAGINLARNPSATALAVSDLGSTFMSLQLAKMHSASIRTQPLDFVKSIT